MIPQCVIGVPRANGWCVTSRRSYRPRPNVPDLGTKTCIARVSGWHVDTAFQNSYVDAYVQDSVCS